MPIKSKAQMRLLAMKEKSGELPKGTLRKWINHTPDMKNLPEHIKKAAFDLSAAFTCISQNLGF